MKLWQAWNRGLDLDYCDYIISRSLRHQPMDGTVGGAGQAEYSAVRTSVVRWLDINREDKDIAETLSWFANRANRDSFGLDLYGMSEMQFTEYRGAASGKFDWHQDVQWDNPAPYDRKLSLILQLSEGSDYEGGEFEFLGYPSPEGFRNKGDLLVFPSFFFHRVKTVTSGLRHSLVCWIEGPKFR